MSVIEIDAAWIEAHPLPAPEGGKEERGRILVVGGQADLLGAVRLAGEAALRAGAGKLQITAPAEAVSTASLLTPEARVLTLPAQDAAPDPDLVESLQHADAVLIGPGMAASQIAQAEVLAAEVRGGLVLDAAALAAARRSNRQCAAMVLTPHAGEMARLLGVDRQTVEAEPRAAAERAATALDAVVAMKGPQTFIAAPEGRIARYGGGGPGLGVSGSGDVLAGVVTGLLARGVPPFEATCWGVFLHGEAGRRLARSVGEVGFLSREIAAEIPRLITR